MGIAASMLPEFDSEMATTRRVLAAVPQARFDWRPHPKSWTMGGLATHVASLPNWTAITVRESSFDMQPEGAEPPRNPAAQSPAELVSSFDAGVKAARVLLEGASDAALMAPWTLLKRGEEIFSMPRVAVLRAFVMNHLIHHRGQLSLYFRLADLRVPAVYGPTADEG